MEQKPHSRNRWLLALGCSVLAAVSVSNVNAQTAVAPAKPTPEADWKVNTIAPVTNPIFFEDPVIRSEIRPIFAHHTIDNKFLGGGTAQLYALQLRYAITDRLAFIATQDGYFDVNNDAIGNPDGWMDLAAGFKYALIDDAANQFILTPGLTFHIPTGSRDVFQGRGGGEFNPFVSFAKGFGDFHLTGNLGVRIPVTNDEQNTVAHYSLMADYYACRWFIPFVAVNFWTNLNNGNNFPGLRGNGYDVINFGAGNGRGVTQGTFGAGFRTRVLDNVDLGFSYEIAVCRPYGLTNNRLTMDMCIRF
ncbi:MAG: transporter [Verrucomicrobiaceae bacterium]